MSLSSSVKTKEIEAVYYQQNGRVEFRLQPDKLYSTDLIIGNLGILKAADQTSYHPWAGVYGSVKNATLFDGNTELSNLSDLGAWSGFKMLNKSNQYSKSISTYYNGARHGSLWNYSDTNANCVAAGGLLNHGASISNATEFRDLITKNLESTTYKGLLKLRQVFDLLNKLSYVDTSIFKNFRIVLEFDVNDNRVIGGRSGDGDCSTTRPFLLAHEVIDEEILGSMMGRMGNIIYEEIENDQTQIPAVTGMTNTARYVEQVNNYHVSAFNGKMVGRLLLWKQPSQQVNQRQMTTNGSVAGMGVFNSTGFLGEAEQVRINGRNVIARSGIVGSNRRLAHVVDTWGECSIPTFGNGLAYAEATAIPRSRIVREGNEDYGNLDFVGVDLAGERCSDLQIDLTRRGLFLNSDGEDDKTGANGYLNDTVRTANSKYNSAHNLSIWCEIKKAIVPDKQGGYNVVYV